MGIVNFGGETNRFGGQSQVQSGRSSNPRASQTGNIAAHVQDTHPCIINCTVSSRTQLISAIDRKHEISCSICQRCAPQVMTVMNKTDIFQVAS
jgi:hypothetical protein